MEDFFCKYTLMELNSMEHGARGREHGAWSMEQGVRELRRSDIMIAVTMNSGNSEGVTL